MSLVWGSNRGLNRSSRSTAARLLLASILVTSAAPSSAQSAPPVLPPTREQVTRPPAPPLPPAAPRLEVEGMFARVLPSPRIDYEPAWLALLGADARFWDSSSNPPAAG